MKSGDSHRHLHRNQHLRNVSTHMHVFTVFLKFLEYQNNLVTIQTLNLADL